MKKKLALILAVCMFICLCSCDTHSNDIQYPVTYYYLRQKVAYSSTDPLIVPYIAEGTGHEGDYQYLVGQFVSGSPESKYVSPFPAGTQLEELRLENKRVQVVLSSQMAELNSVSMMVAFACLTKTIADMTGIQTVQIRITDNLINGEESITLSPNSFSYFDSVAADDGTP